MLTMMRALAFQHIDHAVNRAEGSCAAATSATMHDDGSLSLTNRILGSRFCSLLVAADDLAAALDEAENMCWVGGCAEIRPARVLELRDLAKGLKGGVGIGECHFTHDDMGIFWVHWRLQGRRSGLG